MGRLKRIAYDGHTVSQGRHFWQAYVWASSVEALRIMDEEAPKDVFCRIERDIQHLQTIVSKLNLREIVAQAQHTHGDYMQELSRLIKSSSSVEDWWPRDFVQHVDHCHRLLPSGPRARITRSFSEPALDAHPEVSADPRNVIWSEQRMSFVQGLRVYRPPFAKMTLTGKPSRCHVCKRSFFAFIARRRHQCRQCGRAVCDDCSPHRWATPEPVEPTSDKFRVCNVCELQFANSTSAFTSSGVCTSSSSPDFTHDRGPERLR